MSGVNAVVGEGLFAYFSGCLTYKGQITFLRLRPERLLRGEAARPSDTPRIACRAVGSKAASGRTRSSNLNPKHHK